MINNVHYIYAIIELKQVYPHLQRNSGTNQLEARHAVLNSMKPKKGTVKFQHIRHMIDVRTLQHNIRRLFKLANQSIVGDDDNINTSHDDSIHMLRVRRLRQHILTTFENVLPPLQSNWYTCDNTWFPSPNWLPVHGHPHGCIWRTWLVQPFSLNTTTSMYNQFKIYRNKRLGDISGIDVISMVLEFYLYQKDERNGQQINQDVRQLKHHLASKVFNNQRTVDV